MVITKLSTDNIKWRFLYSQQMILRKCNISVDLNQRPMDMSENQLVTGINEVKRPIIFRTSIVFFNILVIGLYLFWSGRLNRKWEYESRKRGEKQK